MHILGMFQDVPDFILGSIELSISYQILLPCLIEHIGRLLFTGIRLILGENLGFLLNAHAGSVLFLLWCEDARDIRRTIRDVAAWHAAHEFAVHALYFGDVVRSQSTAVSAIPHLATPLRRCGRTCRRRRSAVCHHLVNDDTLHKGSLQGNIV